ncbi:AarF/ABC1/UbiB kinase family protein [Parasphingopyxis algicola]|uniref:ABC1 kinase family protein n=1 Tax=Parasphingopyxis algicola TaxID=2026624 RepID=UPI0015A3DD5E|nr:AarF/ABC1/UbiB kinase family protein [Parasphingopyxis algicola]QLC26608.1 AarF/ABC1/UbiB kinase family protein [Parasphingopyxis algicola]
MTDQPSKRRSRSVPRSRLSRLGSFGRLAGSVAGGVLAEGTRRIASGERPRMRDLVMTPRNFSKLTERLSHLRGAAMKLGQMISMDAGDMLPRELAEIMARLRDQAHHMPPGQLNRVLESEWGRDWRGQFAHFNATPLAAASIGQVHRATTKDGRALAIKVQYPGVRESIDADVDNVATLLRVSGLLPNELEIGPLLEAAKTQLRAEADYLHEGAQMRDYAALLDGDPDYLVPGLQTDLTTGRVLAMTFIEGVPIERAVGESQERRDALMEALIRLVLRELFEFGVMQTDPNFANYRYQPDSGKLVLLDFGATRPVAAETANGYRDLLAAGLSEDRDAVRAAAIAAGFINETAVVRHRVLVDEMIDIIVEEMNRRDAFDFGDRAFVSVLRDQGMAVAEDRASWHIPPADTLFVQRKISGTALIAARLKARVDVRSMVSDYLGNSVSPA